jgi:hypothetical protein
MAISLVGLYGALSMVSGTGAATLAVADAAGITPTNFEAWPPVAIMGFIAVITMVLKDRSEARQTKAISALADAIIKRNEMDAVANKARDERGDELVSWVRNQPKS